jgi:hypothetical protein
MRRVFLGAGMAFLLLTGALQAELVHGKVKKVDLDKGTLTVQLSDKEQEFTINKETKFVLRSGKAIDDGLKSGYFRRKGNEVEVSFDLEDGKEIVRKIRVLSGLKKN